MTDHLFICEKPNLAEEVAKAWAEARGQSAQKTQTHWTVGQDQVTWLVGHMYEQAQAQEYDPRYKSWTVEDLPIVPVKWKLLPAKNRDGSSKLGRIKEIQGLIKGASKVVNVGDAGREGQLLVDELLLEAGRDPFGPDALRLWCKSLTRKDLLAAIAAMFPNADKRNLYEAAVTRQRADWLHGINMTRLMTVQARKSGMQLDKALSVGRVQTPTIRLVVDRDRQVEAFKPVDHFMPTGTFVHANGSFKATWIIPPDHAGLDHEGRLVDRAVADAVAAKVAGRTGRVESREAKPKSKAPPLPPALSNLQTECSARYGFSGDRTLDIAQALYEKKVTTYPRSDSQYLMQASLDDVPGILANLGRMPDWAKAAEGANPRIRTAVWNDSKVSDHHAIIPTEEASPDKVASLSPDERKVFAVIARLFLAQFYPDQRWDAMTAVVEVEGERFKAVGRRVTEVGWRVLYGADKEEDEEDEGAALPEMARADPVKAEAVASDARRTKPPSYFTDGTLIEALKNIHKFVPDAESKRILKENMGIATEATRAPMIKSLKEDKGFLVPKGKFLVSSPLARSLVDILDPKLKDPAITAFWEAQLERISIGEMQGERFLAALVKEVEANVADIGSRTLKLAGAREPLPGHGEPCPKCGVGKLQTRVAGTGPHKGKAFLSCDNYRKDDPASCSYSKWPEDARKPVAKIEGDGDPCPSCGKGRLQTRVVNAGEQKGKSFLSCDGFSKADPASCRYTQWPRPKVDPLPGDGQPCPKCGKGRMQTRVIGTGPHKGKKFLTCDNYRKDDPTSCDHRAWPAVEPLPGDGNPCPACAKGKLRTRKTREDKRFLSCDAYSKDDPASCRYVDWGKPVVEPLPGDGVLCEKCADGRMVTKAMKDGRRFLSCSGYRKDDERSCNKVIWPDDDGKGKPKGGSKAGAKAPAGRAPAKAAGARKVAARR